jgi:hypothetical protein
MFSCDISRFAALAIFLIHLISSCGKSGPDSKDEPTFLDSARHEIFGHPLYSPLNTVNKKFTGNLNANNLNDSEFEVKLLSIPSSISESKRHNLELLIVGQLKIHNKIFAITGRNSHTNWLCKDCPHPALKSRQFIEFSPTIVMPSNHKENDVILEPVPEFKDNNDWLYKQFDRGTPAIGLRFIAELKDNNLVDGLIRATYCPSAGGSCWQEDVGSWSASEIEILAPEVLDNNTIQFENLVFANEIDGNIRRTVVKLSQ